MGKLKIWIPAFAGMTMFVLAQASEEATVKRARQLMGTLCEIEVSGESKIKLTQAITPAFKKIQQLDFLFSGYSKSEMYRVNQYAALQPQGISTDTMMLLTKSIDLWYETFGYFDVAFRSRAPSAGITDLELDKQRQTVYFRSKGVSLGLHGIAKGYAMGKAADILKTQGIKDGRINFGGQILVFGKPQTIKIWGPDYPSKAIRELTLENQSISVSSRYLEWNEKTTEPKYHIINPKTKEPVKTLFSAFAVVPDATKADALSTALLAMGIKDGLDYANFFNICAAFYSNSEFFPSNHCAGSLKKI